MSGHIQIGCEAMADSFLVFVLYEPMHRTLIILKQVGKPKPDGLKMRTVKGVTLMKAINSICDFTEAYSCQRIL